MLHVLRHYLPLRKALLILSETLILTLAVSAGMTLHLWAATDEVRRRLAESGLDPGEAFVRVGSSALLIAALCQVTIAFHELYEFRISNSRYERAARFLGAAGVGVLLSLAVTGIAKAWNSNSILHFPGLPFSQVVVFLTGSLGVGFGLLYIWRNIFHNILKRGRFGERLLVLGGGRIATRLVEELESREDSGYLLVGVVHRQSSPDPEGGERRRRRSDDDSTGNPWFSPSTEGRPSPGEGEPEKVTAAKITGAGAAAAVAKRHASVPHIRAEDESIHVLARRLGVDDIVVAFEERRGSLPTDELLACRLDGIIVQEAESFFERLTGKIPVEAMRPSYLIFNKGFVQHPLSQGAKRAVDLVLTLIGIFLTWPLMLGVALAVRLDSPGPVLFKQERTGLHGRPFNVAKFRSMRVDAEKLTGPVWAQEDDPRITKVGKFLRKTRLDELPQLFNVLTGSMSLVGPRPERPHFVGELADKIPYFHQRHIVKPGVTGWAQINYPYGNTLEDALQKLQYDLFYIKYQSVLFDMSILFNTVKTVLLRKGT
ncbi:MAG: lipopolysaccharide/colanic/teichoic acid biosynthesis glycosyltransferase [Planctomycetota bacterium]|jgi:lipopolysaccharide/colanic/teichoic acid biosynthesis glycosyltransferase